jgi:hypothetical protein
VRIFKLFNLVKKKGEDGGKAKDELEEPSVVGKKLAELTTRKVILGVMLMVAVLPLLNAEVLDSSHISQVRDSGCGSVAGVWQCVDGSVAVAGVFKWARLTQYWLSCGCCFAAQCGGARLVAHLTGACGCVAVWLWLWLWLGCGSVAVC